jgi:hypothetical protein
MVQILYLAQLLLQVAEVEALHLIILLEPLVQAAQVGVGVMRLGIPQAALETLRQHLQVKVIMGVMEILRVKAVAEEVQVSLALTQRAVPVVMVAPELRIQSLVRL